MASPRPSSPSAPGSPGEFDLSPRSKIKALLAQVDDDSEGDDSEAGKFTKTEAAGTSIAAPPTATFEHGSDNDDEDDEDDEQTIRPRGRIAARMFAKDKTSHNTESENEGDARDRVREMLRKGAAGETAKEGSILDMAAENEDNDGMPVRKRKLQNRQRRSPTPEATTPTRERSPGMFVTPEKPDSPAQKENSGDSESDLDLPSLKNDRFKALVTKKRKEARAREAEEERKREARAAAMQSSMQGLEESDGDVSDITDDEGGRKLTQDNARPARKASKKAMEEMNRETQRMSRALQLAHEAKTKKKITKASLFERFNFKPQGAAVEEKLSSSSRPTTPVSAQHTDTEMKDVDTPPSSPPARIEDVLGKDPKTVLAQEVQPQGAQIGLTTISEDVDEDLPSLADASAAGSQQSPKEKSVAPTGVEGAKEKKPATKRNIRVRLPTLQVHRATVDLDDDLVVAETKKSKIDAIFDRVPAKKAKETPGLLALRHLAHLDDPEKKANKKLDRSALTAAELQAQLQQRARQQAKLERDRRLEMLKAKGVHIQTEEEREQELAQVEDIVARARLEAEEIMQREREAARKAKKESGEVDPLAWDDSDGSGGDYEEDAEEPSDVELSGSEVDGEEEGAASGEDDEHSSKKTSEVQAMVDEEADSDDSESEADFVDPDEEEELHRWGKSEDEAEDEDEDEEMTEAPIIKIRRPKKHATILSDDEEDTAVEATPRLVEATPRPKNPFLKSPAAPDTTSPEVPTSVLRSATKTFIPGLPVAGPAGLGLTQIFAGTMDDSQVGPASGSPQEFMPSFDNFPDSQFSQKVGDSQPQGTQTAATQQESETQGIEILFTPSQVHGFDSLLQVDATQTSDLQPSQDRGFQNFTPLKERFIEAPASTIDTVLVNHTQPTQPTQQLEENHDSPLVRKKGRLRRKIAAASDSEGEADDDHADMDVEEDEYGFGTTAAFDVMKAAAIREKKQKVKADFDKKKSKAKEMVEDQAEESEDEYAGLGGVDGEDSDDDDAASVHEMIDDVTQGNQVDDAKLAAFYADRERQTDEKQVEKLFRDITSGMLRRKRGADYDLSDSDDGGEARRRMKRRQFAKMQKALFADERISKVAENPRNQAFLRTIEDRNSDDEMDFILEAAPPPPPPESEESQSQEQTIPDSQPATTTAAAPGAAAGGAAPARRPLAPDAAGNRLPAASRRTKDGKKPSNLGEIRESLSNLLDDPSGHSIISATDLGSDSDDNDAGDEEEEEEQDDAAVAPPRGSDEENAQPRANRRRRGGRHVEVVDRISLKRNSSSASASSSGSGASSRLAFAMPGASAAAGSFKVPALLRRATTNSLMSGSGNSPTGGGGGGGSAAHGEEAKIKKGAGKRSGVNFFARESERRKAVEESEKRREARKWKGAEEQRRVVGGLFGAGKFE